MWVYGVGLAAEVNLPAFPELDQRDFDILEPLLLTMICWTRRLPLPAGPTRTRPLQLSALSGAPK